MLPIKRRHKNELLHTRLHYIVVMVHSTTLTPPNDNRVVRLWISDAATRDNIKKKAITETTHYTRCRGSGGASV